MNPGVMHYPAGHGGEFVIEENGQRLGRLNYTRRDDRVEILHTEVDPLLRGTGAGGKLVAAVVHWARAERLRVTPLCAYAKSVFARTADYADVLS
jgi:predicted GNAT family acetyltransferase